MFSSFRQGLISYQENSLGQPQFLLPSGTAVELNVSPTPTVATFAHLGANYLQVFKVGNQSRWTTITPGVNNFLYWDISLLNGEVTTGVTTRQPIISATEPQDVSDDQHWFDLTTTTMKVWDAARSLWRQRVRVFAGVVRNGNLTTIDQYTKGSQVGLNEDTLSGFLLLDENGKLIRKPSGEILTSSTQVMVKTTSGTSGVTANPVGQHVFAQAGSPIPKFTAVKISGEDKVSTAFPGDTVIGISMNDAPEGTLVQVVSVGELSFDQWAWQEPGATIWLGSNGELLEGSADKTTKIGVVKNPTTIILGIDSIEVEGLSPPVSTLVANNPLVSEREGNTVYLSINPSSEANDGFMSNADYIALQSVKAFHSQATGGSFLPQDYKIGNMANVEIGIAPPDKAVLSYDAMQDKWVAATFLSNQDGGPIPDGAVLIYDGEQNTWVPADIFAPVTGGDNPPSIFDEAFSNKKLNDLSDVNVDLALPGDVLSFDGVNWVSVAVPGVGTQIVTSVAGRTGAITLTTTDVAEGANLYYTTERFIDDFNTNIEISSIKLLSDVSDEMSPEIGEVLTWDGEFWTSMSPPEAPVLSVNSLIGNVSLTTTEIPEGNNLYFTTPRFLEAFNEAFSEKVLNDLADVNISAVAEAGSVLGFNGATWEAVPLTGAESPIEQAVEEAVLSLRLDDLSNVNIGAIENGHTIVWLAEAQEWVNTVPPSAPVTSVNSKVGEVLLTTDDIPQGLNNFYFTEENFTAAFGALIPTVKLADLFDVDESTIPEDGFVLSYDAVTEMWKAKISPSAPVTSVNTKIGAVELTTNDIPEPVGALGEPNLYFTTDRVNQVIESTLIEALANVEINTAETGQYLVFDGSNWVNSGIVQGAAGANSELQVNVNGAFGTFSDLKFESVGQARIFTAGSLKLMTGGENLFGSTYSTINIPGDDFGISVGGELGLKVRHTKDLYAVEMPAIMGGDGGSIALVARNGAVQGPGAANGGSITLTIGRAAGDGSGIPGSFVVNTTTAEHLRIEANSGAFFINNSSGNNGQVLTSTGPSTPPIWANPAPMAAGLDKQIQFNNNGATVGSNKLTWDNSTSILRVGFDGVGTITNQDGGLAKNDLVIKGGAGDIFEGGDLILSGGDGGPSTEGGDVVLRGGTSFSSAAAGRVLVEGGTPSGGAGPGGDVLVTAGSGTGVGAGGNVVLTPGTSSGGVDGSVKIRTHSFVQFQTSVSTNTEAFVNRFAINRDGSWSLGEANINQGTNGQVLTSTGPSTPPEWRNPGATTAAGSTGQIQYNDAGALAASSSFVFDAPTNTIALGTNTIPGSITGNDIVSSALTLRGGNSSGSASAGSLNLLGGNSAGSGNGGAIVIAGGESQSGAPGSVTVRGANAVTGSLAGNGGSVTISGGTSTDTGSSGSVFIQTLGSGSGSGGNIVFSTNNVQRISINKNGSVTVGANAGTSGQVLRSTGPSTPPEWGDATPRDFMTVALSDENTTSLTTATNVVTFRAPFAMNLYQVPRASLSSASSSGNVVVDINVNGTSILGASKLSIDATEKTSTTAVNTTSLAVTSIADDAEITMDIDAAGSNARGLKVTLYFTRA